MARRDLVRNSSIFRSFLVLKFGGFLDSFQLRSSGLCLLSRRGFLLSVGVSYPVTAVAWAAS